MQPYQQSIWTEKLLVSLSANKLIEESLFEAISLHGLTGPLIIWILISVLFYTLMAENAGVNI
jgi:hypothetical protein